MLPPAATVYEVIAPETTPPSNVITPVDPAAGTVVELVLVTSDVAAIPL